MENNKLPEALYDMQLHEIIVVEGPESTHNLLITTAMRVPGGWIYRTLDRTNGLCTSSFVPYSNEHQPRFSFE